MTQVLVSIALLFAAAGAQAAGPADVICAFAPSQSKAAMALSAAAGGGAAAVEAVVLATGMSAVAHSSGAVILTGSGGYVAGTLGSAIVAPTIVTVGLVVGAAAVTVELLCAPKNHPAYSEKVKEAAIEFGKRTGGAFAMAKAAISPRVSRATLKVKEVSGNVARYAFRRSTRD